MLFFTCNTGICAAKLYYLQLYGFKKGSINRDFTNAALT
jgi:hypothetical protein